MLRALAEVGLRRGEVRGLRWPDINPAAPRLTVTRQVVDERSPGGGRRKLVKAPKSGRTSVVAISPTFAARLADWYAVSVIEGGGPADGDAWPGRNRGPMNGRSLAQTLERACERIGLGEYYETTSAKGERVTRFRALLSPHRVRHSAASVMISAGVPLPAVAAQLTHSEASITARTYAHVIDDDLDRAAAIFERHHGEAHSEVIPARAETPH